VGAHSRDFPGTVNTFFITFLSNGHLLGMAGKKPAKTPVYGGFLSSFICLSALSPAARRYEFAPLSFFSTPGTEKLLA
jgi:hypothetical protein